MPGLNIYRSPLCGRNFEYLGEDPYLAARLVVPLVQNLQAGGVLATAKHFAANNQEYDRNRISSNMDERTLRGDLPAGLSGGGRGRTGGMCDERLQSAQRRLLHGEQLPEQRHPEGPVGL